MHVSHLQMHNLCSVYVIIFDISPYHYLMPSTNYRAPLYRVLFRPLFLSLSLRPNILSSLCSQTSSMCNVGAVEMRVYKLDLCLTVHHQLGKVIQKNQLDATIIY